MGRGPGAAVESLGASWLRKARVIFPQMLRSELRCLVWVKAGILEASRGLAKERIVSL